MPTSHESRLDKRQWAVLSIVLVSYLIIVLDVCIAITALPKVRQVFAMTTADLSWVQNAYTLAFGGLLLLGARAGDLLGRRRMLILGLGLFTLASLVVAIAPDEFWLISGRAVQGVGAAILAPSTLALLMSNFNEGPLRIRAVSYYSAVAGIGASLGIMLGGFLTQWLSWRVGFLINVPIGLALMIAALRVLSETPVSKGAFDVFGALLSTSGMTSLVFGIVRSASTGWDSSLLFILAGVGLLLVFALHEAHVDQPILPLRLFAHRTRLGGYLGRMLFLGGTIGFWFFTTQLLQEIMGFSPAEAGLAFLPATLVNFFVALSVPRMTRHIDSAYLLAAGVAAALAGLTWLGFVSTQTHYLTGIAIPMVLVGIGQGTSFGALTAAGLADVAPEDAGAASGLINTTQQLGGALGLAALTAVYSQQPAVQGHHVAGIAAAYSAGAVLLGLSLICIIVMIVRPSLLQTKIA